MKSIKFFFILIKVESRYSSLLLGHSENQFPLLLSQVLEVFSIKSARADLMDHTRIGIHYCHTHAIG